MNDQATPVPSEGVGVTMPTMKSLYVEVMRGEFVLGTATAFLVANDQKSHCSLVTNRHVVTGRHQDSGVCLHSQGAEPDRLAIYFHSESEKNDDWRVVTLPLFRDDGSPYWIEHPRLGPNADIVALNLNWGGDVTKYPYYLATDLDRFGIEIGPAETVSVIGFPFGLSSVGRFPIWATGFLAQELSLISPENPVFLIDCRSRQGQSGSPVIAYRVGSFRQRTATGTLTTLTDGVVWEFLGVYSGRVNEQSDLGRVWHASAVRELLEAATEEMARRTAAASAP